MSDANSCCPTCKAPIVQRKTGRPAIFCSTACRKAANLKVQRLNKRIGELEVEAEAARAGICTTLVVLGIPREEQLAHIESEIQRYEQELRKLLAAD